LKAYQQAAALDPRSAEVRAEMSALYARQNREREAVEWAEAALKLDAQNAEANRVLGIIYAGRARLDDESAAGDADAMSAAKKAVASLEAAKRRSVSVDPALDMMLARLYLRTGDDERAIAALRPLVEQQDLDSGEPAALLAQVYVHAGRTDDAIRLLEGAIASYPEFYASLGELYENQRRWKDAAAAYERAVARNPRNVELRTRLGEVLLSLGGGSEAARAAAVLEDARKLTPTNTHVLYLLAQAQREAGQLDRAETTAKQLAALAPSGPSAPYALAQIYDQKQQYRRVVETLEPVVERAKPAGSDPRLSAVLLMLGSAYEELGAFDRAIATFERAKTLTPGNRNIDVYELGVLVSARRFPEALERSEALLRSQPGDQRVLRLRAEALRGTGRTQEAVDLLKGALATHADDATAYLALSELYAAVEQYGAAARVLADAGRKFPADLTVKFQLGSVLEREKRFADAERVFRQVISEDPLYAPALNYLGYMMADRGERLDESIALIKRALAVEPFNGAYLDSLGWAYFKANRLDLAEESLRKAADQRVRDSAVQDHFGDLLFRLGRYKDAIGAWRNALAGDGEQVNRDDIERKIRSAAGKAAKQ
jgi:tetratricopeptide (TPR) repeat protein